MKLKRPLAILGLIVILSIYVIAIVSAFSHSPQAATWLMAAVFSSVIVPIFFYAGGMVYRILKRESGNKGSDPNQ
ncbi:MAG: hypothetical protein QM657_06560 [Lacrimispora sp.]|uniref:hypothetical protein n=1 Tax=Lacrimispora sp. TaxID=2719234 RepID=UPI0039E2CF6F